MVSSKDLLLFKALGERTKHAILKELSGKELCACELPLRIGRTQSNTSMHLAKLSDWGIIKARKDGRKVMYSIADKRVLQLLKIIYAKKV